MREIATSNCLSFFFKRELLPESILIHPQYVFIEHPLKIPTGTALGIRKTVVHKILECLPWWNLYVDKGERNKVNQEITDLTKRNLELWSKTC